MLMVMMPTCRREEKSHDLSRLTDEVSSLDEVLGHAILAKFFDARHQ